MPRPLHRRRPVARLLAFLLLALLLASCRKKQAWQSDFDAALQDARRQEKRLFVLFSLEDWDGRTAGFRSDVLDTDEFRAFVKDGYVLLNVDLSDAEQAKALVQSGAGERELAAAALIQPEIDAKSGIIRRYGVSSCPSLYILSKEGYVLSIVQYNEALSSPSVLMEIYEEQEAAMTAMEGCISRLQTAEGAEKVRAIDALYEATAQAARRPLADLVREVPSLDPDNRSGLVGKYEFIATYDEVMDRVSEGEQEGLPEAFARIAETGHLEPAQKLEAFYNAAYLMALFGDDDYDRMYELLGKAREADPESIRVGDIDDLMLRVAAFREILGQDEGLFPGLAVEAD